MTSENDICVWDNTLPAEHHTVDSIKKWCKKWCKKWGFQLEQGKKTGYMHYQLRISLKKGTRNMTKHLKPCDWSITSSENRTNLFYVMKEDTRIDRPWCDFDSMPYIPIQYRDLTLKKWQQEVLNVAKKFDTRKINIIVDTEGCIGKSVIACHSELEHGGFIVPPINDAKDMVQAICDFVKAKEATECSPIFLDMPRSMPKNKLQGIYAGLEQIKNGRLYDTRYGLKIRWIDSPCIWVFTNKPPNDKYLTADRWQYWKVANDELIALAGKQLTTSRPSAHSFDEAELEFDWECQQMIEESYSRFPGLN